MDCTITCLCQLLPLSLQALPAGLHQQWRPHPSFTLSTFVWTAPPPPAATAQVPCPQVGDVIVRIIGGAAASLYLKLVLLDAGPVRDVAVASVGSQVRCRQPWVGACVLQQGCKCQHCLLQHKGGGVGSSGSQGGLYQASCGLQQTLSVPWPHGLACSLMPCVRLERVMGALCW